MVVWLSPQFSADAGVDRGCLRAESAAKMSHDNLFHSVLGLLDVQTSVYKADRDLFAPCRHDRGQTFAATMAPGSRLAR
jgi:lipid A ethanolaminephosphotransferase